jgi:hypothetical protein
MKDVRRSEGERGRRSGGRYVVAGCVALVVAVAGAWLMADNRGYSVSLLPRAEWGFGVEYSWTYYTPFNSMGQEVGRKYGVFAVTRR